MGIPACGVHVRRMLSQATKRTLGAFILGRYPLTLQVTVSHVVVVCFLLIIKY